MPKPTCKCEPSALAGVCARCGREICPWHTNGQPEIINGAIALVKVCAPSCIYLASAPVARVREWRPE
jgi:hypothetical protein